MAKELESMETKAENNNASVHCDPLSDLNNIDENQSGECVTSDSEKIYPNLKSNDVPSPTIPANKLHQTSSPPPPLAATTTTTAQPQTQLPQSHPIASCTHHQQTTTVSYTRNGHSRNPSSINGITIATQQVAQPPPNKPDAIDSLLKLIGFRGAIDDEKANNKQICGIREARLFSKFAFI